MPWDEVLPGVSAVAVRLAAELLLYNPDDRLSASAAMLHEYFFSPPLPAVRVKLP